MLLCSKRPESPLCRLPAALILAVCEHIEVDSFGGSSDDGPQVLVLSGVAPHHWVLLSCIERDFLRLSGAIDGVIVHRVTSSVPQASSQQGHILIAEAAVARDMLADGNLRTAALRMLVVDDVCELGVVGMVVRRIQQERQAAQAGSLALQTVVVANEASFPTPDDAMALVKTMMPAERPCAMCCDRPGEGCTVTRHVTPGTLIIE